MTNATDLPYYPRFIFNCSDDRCFSTGDLDYLKFIKEKGSEYEITRFKKGQILQITWEEDNGKKLVKDYEVSDVEIAQIKYDVDEPTYGINSNDCTGIYGKEKKWLMEIYIFLKALD
nr:hypothetical protein [Pedobacter kyonggii]